MVSPLLTPNGLLSPLPCALMRFSKFFVSCDPCSYTNLVPFSAGVPGDSSGLLPLTSPEAMVLTGPARLEGLPWAAAGLVRSKCTGAMALPERRRTGSPASLRKSQE